MDQPPHATDRVIRVFISSTFRDMMRERDLLVKEVFPELRRKCARRFVTFTEVDLRWGITEEQANEGQVLPLCLAEIERSRPYFIGLLGERYGWIPDTIRPEVIEREPWLKEHVQGRTSVTELEILHGVLNNPTAAAWVARVRQRNHADLRPWYDEGANALQRADVRTRLEDLERSLAERLSRLRRIVDAPGNLPAHNPRFVGREAEMERLHKAAGLGQYGVLTAVQGVGGMGKTAIAIQYAYAYADFYPGGRWMVGCAGRSSLAAALRSLDSDLGIQFTDEEKLDDSRAARRVLAVLQDRSERGAQARAGEQNPPSPRALLILDNVDEPVILQPPHVDLLSGKHWLHVIATTRLDPDRIGMDGEQHCHMPIDELPAEDALHLIESYQPHGQFQDDAECCAAREIVRLLRGFTLAVEVVAVHLGERKGKITCAGLLNRLQSQNVDGIARQTSSGVSHVEKLLSKTLAPTLETLDERETRVLLVAALLPSDSVPVPWLREVVAESYPELGQDAEAGYDDPWLTQINHLVGLRLLQVLEWAGDNRTPRICRIHRLVQAVVRQQTSENLSLLEKSLMDTANRRAQFLVERWLSWDCRWEIQPLAAFAWQALQNGPGERSFAS
jgi:hypothetical protein